MSRSVHVDAAVDVVVVLKSGPMKMPMVFVAVYLAFPAAKITARWPE